MRNKRKRPTDGGGNWMDTYGDMVTLLLTFFIMLFAMSNLNEQKWEVFVRSIYPRSTQEVQEQVSINSPVGNAESEMEGTLDVPETETPVDIDKLYLTLAERMNEIGIDGVTVSRGEYCSTIIEGIIAIQSGENPKYLREHLLASIKQSQQRKLLSKAEAGSAKGGGGDSEE